jgi:uncharacterized membrane protein
VTEFVLALTAFVAAHLIPASPGLRRLLVARMGRRPYLAAYSLLSIGLLAWLIVAARRADTIPLWDPAPWQWRFAALLMPFAAFFVTAGLLAPNPLSISFRAGAEPGAIVRITRHPIVWGFLIWAVAHSPPNGDLVALALFGGMAAFSLAGFALLDAKARRRLGPDRWARVSRTTSIVPFAALLSGRTRLGPVQPLALAGIVAAAFYLWFVLRGHLWLIGADPLALVDLG